MRKQVSEILNEFSSNNLLRHAKGPDNIVTGISDIKDCSEGDLVFIENEKFVSYAQSQKPSAVVINEKLIDNFNDVDEISIVISAP